MTKSVDTAMRQDTTTTEGGVGGETVGRRCDVLIVGGGVAGLAAAVALGRSLRSVVVIDAGEQRNLPADGAHNVLGHEGIAPEDLTAAGRAEAIAYGVHIEDDAVVDAERIDGGFRVTLGSGESLTVRRILLATGLIDELPEIDGLAEGWGATVLHCPYCHGWEIRGQRIGVVATGPTAEHQALLFRRLSEHVSVFDHGGVVDGESRRRLHAMGVDVVDGVVDAVVVEDRRVRSIVVDDELHRVDAVVITPRMRARAEVFEMLGGAVTQHPLGTFIETDQTGRTSVDGVWAAGNVRDLAAMVGASAGAGVLAGAAVNADLVEEELQRALEYQRAMSG